MDQPSVVKLLLEHREGLFAFVLALTRDYDLAEEVFQEVGVAILEEAGKGEAVRDFLPWARTIARHRLADVLRRKEAAGRLRVRVSERMGELVQQAFDETLAQQEVLQRRLRYLGECVRKLPGRMRELVERRYGRGESIGEIAAGLAWERGSVKVGLSRARKALGECMERRVRDEEGG